MGMDEDAAKTLAGEFLEKASKGARGKDLAPYLESLKPYLDTSIRKAFSRWPGPKPISQSDLAQILYEKFLKNPPTRTGAENPLARILAWAGTTAFRQLVSEKRASTIRSLRSEEIIHQVSNPAADSSLLDIVEQRLENQVFIRYLELEAPASLVETARKVFETGSVDSHQLGALLGISSRAAYKRLQRLRALRAMFDTMREEVKKHDAKKG
jgi:hypothetical protein